MVKQCPVQGCKLKIIFQIRKNNTAKVIVEDIATFYIAGRLKYGVKCFIACATCITRPVATDDPVAWCVTVCLSCACARPAKKTKRFEVLFGVKMFADQGTVY